LTEDGSTRDKCCYRERPLDVQFSHKVTKFIVVCFKTGYSPRTFLHPLQLLRTTA
jgi:hypothetical protein